MYARAYDVKQSAPILGSCAKGVRVRFMIAAPRDKQQPQHWLRAQCKYDASSQTNEVHANYYWSILSINYLSVHVACAACNLKHLYFERSVHFSLYMYEHFCLFHHVVLHYNEFNCKFSKWNFSTTKLSRPLLYIFIPTEILWTRINVQSHVYVGCRSRAEQVLACVVTIRVVAGAPLLVDFVVEDAWVEVLSFSVAAQRFRVFNVGNQEPANLMTKSKTNVSGCSIPGIISTQPTC